MSRIERNVIVMTKYIVTNINVIVNYNDNILVVC